MTIFGKLGPECKAGFEALGYGKVLKTRLIIEFIELERVIEQLNLKLCYLEHEENHRSVEYRKLKSDVRDIFMEKPND